MTVRSMYVYNGSSWDEVGYTIAHGVPAGGATGTVLSKSSATDYDAAWVAQSALTVAQSQVTNLTTDLSAKAPLASPTFTGVPAAPTAAVDTSTTQIATTAFTVAQIADDAVLKTVADAAGDLVVGSAADTFGRLALGTDNHVLTVDTAGSGVAKVGWEDPTANPLTTAAMAAKVNTATVGNLLTANQAGFEDNATTGWAKTGTGSFAASNTYAKSGTYSAAYTAGSYISSDPARTAVTAGKTYTATISYYSPSYTGPITFRAYWATAGNADISYIDGSTTAATTGAWQTLRATGVAPATATSVYFYVSGITAGQTIYVDEAGLWEGAGGQWALPGTPITNLGFYTDESCGRRLFQWDANNSRFQQTYGDTGWRDVSADLINSYTGTLYLRRIGNVIHFVGNITRATSNGALNIPTGFKPTQDSTRYPQFVSRSGTTGTLTSVTVDAQLYIYGVDSNIYPVSGSYIAGEDWPTTLPGTASGSIPA